MGGAQPLAVTLNGGVCLCVDVDRARLAAPGRAPLPGRGRRLTSTTRSPGASRPRRERRALSVGVVGNCARVLPELLRRDVADRHRHRPDLRPRPAVLPARGHRPRATGTTTPRRKPEEFTDRARASMAKHVEAMVDFLDARRRGVRLRQLDPRRGPAGRLRPGLRLPRLRPRLHPAAVLRGQGPVPLGRAVRRPGRHPRHRPRPCSTCSRTTTTCTAGSAPRRTGSPSRACRRGSAGSATASGDRAGLRFNDLVASGGL